MPDILPPRACHTLSHAQVSVHFNDHHLVIDLAIPAGYTRNIFRICFPADFAPSRANGDRCVVFNRSFPDCRHDFLSVSSLSKAGGEILLRDLCVYFGLP